MNLLSSLESSGDISKEPDKDFLIFLVGDEFYDDKGLTTNFRQYFGGPMLDAIDTLIPPHENCSGQTVSLPNGFDGLLVFIDPTEGTELNAGNCIVKALQSSWDATGIIDDKGSFADNLTALIATLGS